MRDWLVFVFVCVLSAGSVAASGSDSIFHWLKNAESFGLSYPQEKVYLHLDNTSYYYGDDIWFKAYVVNSFDNTPTAVSGTLYVDLLTPGGEVIDKKVLKIKDGQCHGDFTLNRVPFYSGFYEIRAYTKYMANFGDELMYSRIIPVFDQPRNEGDFSEKKMRKYGSGKYAYSRKKPHKGAKLNLKFYPEGGHLIAGNKSRVGFEATDSYGHPVNVEGYIRDEGNKSVSFSTSHEGKGVFEITPEGSPMTAYVTHEGKEYKFDLPETMGSGYTMTVDNVKSKDSVFVKIQHHNIPQVDILGLAVLNMGILHSSYLVIPRHGEVVNLAVDKSMLPAGVAQILLFNSSGEILSDRLIFNEGNCRLNVHTEFDKKNYAPYDEVNARIRLEDSDGNPVAAPFSLSVRECDGEVRWERNALTDLLLMSEIKGYVSHPDYYFESDDEEHRRNLDLLMLVQGWRRHSWDRIIGKEEFDLKYSPEDTVIDVDGRVLSLVKKVPKPGVDVSAFLMRRNEDTYNSESYAGIYTTDSLGRFHFSADVNGEWSMVLSLREKGKKKDYMIQLDRLFSPSPRQYAFTDMELAFNDGSGNAGVLADESADDNDEGFVVVFNDSVAKGTDRMKELPEVVVKGKKRSKERAIYKARSKSIAYYDVKSGTDDIRDEGEYIGDDIHKFLINMNRNFSRTLSNGEEYLLYKGRMPLFVINYMPTYRSKFDYDKYKYIRLEAIKSIYISEDLRSMCEYADPMIIPFDIDKLYGCVVFIETYPDGEIPVDGGKGVRKTRLEGYSPVREFYNPDYSMLEPEPDYRRTLYWNPDLSTDENGEATVRFYNNGAGGDFTVDLQTVTPSGLIGVSE